MEIKFEHGDWALNGMGMPITIDASQADLQHIRTRLQVPRGSFLLDPTFGSRLFQLKDNNPGDPDQQARQYAQEALLCIPGVQVLEARVTHGPPMTVRVQLHLNEVAQEVECSL